eukprot:scaffold1147_cov250-Pinguiococcus_pyrenoidosus.AAC.13
MAESNGVGSNVCVPMGVCEPVLDVVALREWIEFKDDAAVCEAAALRASSQQVLTKSVKKASRPDLPASASCGNRSAALCKQALTASKSSSMSSRHSTLPVACAGSSLANKTRSAGRGRWSGSTLIAWMCVSRRTAMQESPFASRQVNLKQADPSECHILSKVFAMAASAPHLAVECGKLRSLFSLRVAKAEKGRALPALQRELPQPPTLLAPNWRRCHAAKVPGAERDVSEAYVHRIIAHLHRRARQRNRCLRPYADHGVCDRLQFPAREELSLAKAPAFTSPAGSTGQRGSDSKVLGEVLHAAAAGRHQTIKRIRESAPEGGLGLSLGLLGPSEGVSTIRQRYSNRYELITDLYGRLDRAISERLTDLKPETPGFEFTLGPELDAHPIAG